jgi:hypothetical protein
MLRQYLALLRSASQTVVHGRLVVRGGPQAISEEKALQKLSHTERMKNTLKLPSLVDLQQKGELVLSITSCPSVHYFRKFFELLY